MGCAAHAAVRLLEAEPAAALGTLQLHHYPLRVIKQPEY